MAVALDPCHDQSQAGIGDEQWWLGNDLMNVIDKNAGCLRLVWSEFLDVYFLW
jgi:hypothetical protein